MEVGGRGFCMCLRCCRKRSDDDDSFYDAGNPDVDLIDLAVQKGHTFNAQPEETGSMNADFAHTRVMPTL